jgi:hypothetical protein
MPKRFTHDHLVGAFHIWHRTHQVELDWESLDEGSHVWRVIRSEKRLKPPIDPMQPGARLVMEGEGTHVIDEDASPGTAYFYTLLVRRGIQWAPEIEARVKADDRFSWFHPDQEKRLAALYDLGRQGTIRDIRHWQFEGTGTCIPVPEED